MSVKYGMGCFCYWLASMMIVDVLSVWSDASLLGNNWRISRQVIYASE